MTTAVLASEEVRDPQPALIALLRLAALECRAAPQAGVPPGEAMQVAATLDMVTMLARMLPNLLLRRPVIWRPGADGRSFDEDWLLALAKALRTGDRDSARFLLVRRARPESAAVLRMLVGDLAERLDATANRPHLNPEPASPAS